MSQRMTVTVTNEDAKNYICKLLILNVMLIMITMVRIMNMKLKYFWKNVYEEGNVFG